MQALSHPALLLEQHAAVPLDTPIHTAFITGDDQSGPENLGNWTTSQGKRLNPMQVYSSARMLRGCVYAVVSA